MLRTATAAFASLLLLALGSCTVYAPMQPSSPAINRAGQAEVGASVQPFGRVEATGAYSPAARVLVTGGLSGSLRLGERTFLASRQYEAGAGLYQPLGQYWVLSGTGGFGQAHSRRGYQDLGNSYSEYEADYRKLYGQFGIAYLYPDSFFGLAYRFTQVNFDYLNDVENGPLPLRSMQRHELTLSAREDLRADSRWQLAVTAGLSISGTPPLDDSYPAHGWAEYHANRNLLPAFLASVGVVYRLGPGSTPARQQPATR